MINLLKSLLATICFLSTFWPPSSVSLHNAVTLFDRSFSSYILSVCVPLHCPPFHLSFSPSSFCPFYCCASLPPSSLPLSVPPSPHTHIYTHTLLLPSVSASFLNFDQSQWGQGTEHLMQSTRDETIYFIIFTALTVTIYWHCKVDTFVKCMAWFTFKARIVENTIVCIHKSVCMGEWRYAVELVCL